MKIGKIITKNRLIRMFEAGTLLLLAAQIILLTINSVRHDRPIIGLRFQGRAMDTYSKEQIAQTVSLAIHDAETQPVTVRAGKYSGHLTPRQLGAVYNSATIIQNIYSDGRSGTFWHKLAVQDLAVLGRERVTVGFPMISSRVAADYFKVVSGQISQTPINARFVVQNDQLSIAPEQSGVKLNNDAALEKLKAYDPSVKPASIVLPTSPVPADIKVNDIRPLLPQVQTATSQPLTMQAQGKSVTLSRQDLADLITPVRTLTASAPSHTTVALTVDEPKLNAKLDALAQQVMVAPQPRVVSGPITINAGQPGEHIDGTHAKIAVVAAIIQREQGKPSQLLPATVNVPVEQIDPPVVAKTAPSNPSQTPAIVDSGSGVTLTFDDGPGQYTEQILDILKRMKVHATFFVVGRNVKNFPSSAKRIVAEGHTLGNHSFTHSDLSRLSPAAVASEISSTQTAVQQITGVTPVLFRPPYGAINSSVKQQVAAAGLQLMMWNVDPRDWSEPGSPIITQRVLAAVAPGSNVLFHVLHQQTVDALPTIIDGLRAKGYVLK